MKSNFMLLELVKDLIAVTYKFGCKVPTAQALLRHNLEEKIVPIAEKFGLSTVECTVLAVTVFQRAPCRVMPTAVAGFFATDAADALEIELQIWKSMATGNLSKYFAINREVHDCVSFKPKLAVEIYKEFTLY